ncbi:MAG: DNA primase [Oscillospiraceae bacterium]|nr:DNA primase [Oscillospiraceae bacterium]
MPLSPSYLDEIVARNPIEDVVSQYVTLTRRSSNLFGLCPFHSEKTPSFSVAPEKGIYYCFGCHKGGGVINFIMEIENLTFREAVAFLAKRAGMDPPEEGRADAAGRERERLLALCKAAARYYHAQLKLPQAQAARDYIAKRGLTGATVTKFGLGYAPDGWTGLIDEMTALGFSKEELLKAGLALKHQTKGTVYDRFRNRLMFPIIDVRGSVIAFGGRVLDDSTPKYLNSSETMIFNKRKNLFALNYAKKSKEDYIILAEGYMDVVTLHQYGFDCAVASLGTALTEDHVTLLSKYTQKIVLTYDADEAGQNATRRALPMLEKAGISVRVLRVQGAKDPDEFLKKYGPDAFRSLLDKSENQAEYFLGALLRKYDLTADDQKVAFAKEATQVIASLPNAVERDVYSRRAAEAAGISADAMMAEIDRARKRLSRTRQKAQERTDTAVAMMHQPKERGLRYDDLRAAMAEEGLLRQLVREPELFGRVDLKEAEFSAPILGRAYTAFRLQYEEGRPVGVSSLGEAFTSAELAHLSGVLQKSGDLVNDRALDDYIRIIRESAKKRENTGQSVEDRLRAAADRANRKT